MFSWPFCTHSSAEVLVMRRMEEKTEEELLKRPEVAVSLKFKNMHVSFENNPLRKAGLLQNNWKKMFFSSEFWVWHKVRAGIY